MQLVYEYSQEPDKPNTGLVMIDGGDAKPLKDYFALKSQYAKTAAPTDSAGGTTSPGQASNCPPQTGMWDISPFQGSDLPEIPAPALQFMTNGAGKGHGLSGGSQTSGGATSNGIQKASTGPASSQSASSSSVAVPGAKVPGLEFGPIVIGAIVVLSSMVGTTLL